MSRRPTVRDVGRLAGVAPSTVSRVFNGAAPISEQTRARVLGAAAELGFRPGKRKRRQPVQVGIVANQLGNGFTARMVQGALETLQAHGVRAVIAPCELESLPEMSSEDLARHLGLQGIQGMIVVAHTVRNLGSLHSGSMPAVLCYCYSERGELPSVLPDDFDGARRATRHLLELGHRNIIFLNGPADWKACRDREEGYRAALTEVGEEISANLISHGSWAVEDGYRRMQSLLKEEVTFSAVFAGNDWLAIGAMDALREQGLRVGRDVGVVGFDDREAAALARPPLTTVRLPLEEVGASAARLLIDGLSRPRGIASGHVSAVMIPCTLVVRSSCGATPGSR